MWIDKFNNENIEAWFSIRKNSIPTGNRDPFVSSLRTASRFISALKGNAESRKSQQLSDLSSAQLYSRVEDCPTKLGKELLKLCSWFSIPETEDLSIMIILLLEGLKQHNDFYLSIVRFWYSVSKKLSIEAMIDNVAVSYLISYLSVPDKKTGYVPLYDIIDDDSLKSLSSFDYTLLNNISLSSDTAPAAIRMIDAIKSYTSRSGRKEMFQALEIMFSFDKNETINRLCPSELNVGLNKRLHQIINYYPGYFTFSSLLYEDGNLMNIQLNKMVKNATLQQIFYGAPGTGKSHAVKMVSEQFPETIRTTFHPDSDYSSFVGAYKPTMSMEDICDEKGEVITLNSQKLRKNQITYKFVKQAFLKAYVKAWNLFKDTCRNGAEITPQFLVIEEINRGNCAQIFGDLFQLLDRKNGFSEYPIEPDEDIVKALQEERPEDGLSFGKNGLQLSPEQILYVNRIFDKPGKTSSHIAEKICMGKVLVLPCNLYIWATMNTSDQSLFPIDSAFKRRWDWKYVPINTEVKKWSIEVEGQKYSWTSFLDKMNEQIFNVTHSEDKKFGFFFCHADKKSDDTVEEEDVISAEKFVSKVIFFIYNDVFKDYGFDRKIFAGEDGKPIQFHEYYRMDGSVDESKVKKFLENVEVKPFEAEQAEKAQE